MATTATLKPTTYLVDQSGGGYVLDPVNALDGVTGTAARAIAESAGQYVGFGLQGFAADGTPADRISVTVRLLLANLSGTIDDALAVFFRAHSADVWSRIATLRPTDVGTAAEWVEFDVHALAGAAPATGFEVAVQFANARVDDPPFPALP